MNNNDYQIYFSLLLFALLLIVKSYWRIYKSPKKDLIDWQTRNLPLEAKQTYRAFYESSTIGFLGVLFLTKLLFWGGIYGYFVKPESRYVFLLLTFLAIGHILAYSYAQLKIRNKLKNNLDISSEGYKREPDSRSDSEKRLGNIGFFIFFSTIVYYTLKLNGYL